MDDIWTAEREVLGAVRELRIAWLAWDEEPPQHASAFPLYFEEAVVRLMSTIVALDKLSAPPAIDAAQPGRE